MGYARVFQRFLLPFLLCLSVVASAAATTAEDKQKHFLWKISGAQGVVYLLGTIHMGKPDLYPLAPVIETSFKQSDELVEEIDLSNANSAQTLSQRLIQQGTYPAGESVANHISRATLARLAAYATKNHLGENYTRLKPWLLDLLITELEAKRVGLDPALGLDRHFLKQAVQSRKPVSALETSEFQVKLFSSYPEKLQDQLLLIALINAETASDVFDGMLQAWRSGDTEAMEELLTRDLRAYPVVKPVMEKVFDERNEAMTKHIEKLLQTPKTYFVAVGSGHLVGERGILRQLQKKNYAVEQP